jgi:hypothetical protein
LHTTPYRGKAPGKILFARWSVVLTIGGSATRAGFKALRPGAPRPPFAPRAAAQRRHPINPAMAAVQTRCRRWDPRRLDPLVSSLEVSYLTFCIFASNSVALLNFANKLIALSFNHLPIVVGQLAPLLLGFADNLLPVSLHLVCVHFRTSIHVLNRTVRQQSESLRGSDGRCRFKHDV